MHHVLPHLPCLLTTLPSAEHAANAGPEVHHYDLYRLDGPQGRLDMAASFAKAVSLIEWPERMPPSSLPEVHLLVAIHRLSEVGALAPLRALMLWVWENKRQTCCLLAGRAAGVHAAASCSAGAT